MTEELMNVKIMFNNLFFSNLYYVLNLKFIKVRQIHEDSLVLRHQNGGYFYENFEIYFFK